MLYFHYSILIGFVGLLLRHIGSPRSFVLVLIGSIPLTGVFIDVGLRLEPYKFACLAAVVPLFLCRNHIWHVHAWHRFTWFLLWMTLLSAYIALFPPAYFNMDIEGTRALPSRIIVQLGSLWVRIGLIGLIAVALHDPAGVRLGIRVWVTATTLLAAYGLIEEIGHFAGVSIGGVYFGRGLIDNEPVHLQQPMWGITFKRVGALAHEPKMLARALLPSILLLVDALTRHSSLFGCLRRRWIVGLLGLHLTVLLLTFSTGAFLLLPILLALPVIFADRRVQFILHWVMPSFVVATALAAPWAGAIEELVRVRVADRVEMYGGLLQGQKEKPAMNFILEHPASALRGSGVGTQGQYLASFIDPEYAELLASYDDIGLGGHGVESGWLSILLDGGIVGLGLLLWPCVSLWRESTRLIQLQRSRPIADPSVEMLIPCRLLFAATLILMTGMQVEQNGQFMLSAGLLLAALLRARQVLDARHPDSVHPASSESV